jgi:hypothetical protein
MAKLKTREIIILVLAVLAVIAYFGYEYLIAGPASKKVTTGATADSVKVDAFISGITNDLGKDKPSDFDTCVIRRMETDWVKNPFWKKDSYRAWANREGFASGSALAKIIYSGYIDSGKYKMAVINGFEYRIGEQLEIEGYVLKQITPSKILIFNKNTGNKEEIPLQE